jgi:hypothetical protein
MGFELNQEDYTMKKNQMMWGAGLAIVALILCLALTSCPGDSVVSLSGDEGSRAAPTLPGKVSPTDSRIQKYATANQPDSNTDTPEVDPVDVKTIEQAVTLFSQVTSLLIGTTGNTLVTADNSIYNSRFNDLYVDHTTVIEDSLILPLISFVVPINTPNTLTNQQLYGGVTTGTINGSSTSTYIVNDKLGDFFSDYPTPRTTPFKKKGDTYTDEYKGSRTYAITNGFFHAPANPVPNTALKVAGHIYVEYSETYKRTVIDVLDQHYNTSSKTQAKFAVTLVATNGNFGAKFVLRGASAGNSASTLYNTMSTSGDTVFSNLEVYDNAGEPIMLVFETNPVDPPTIPVDHNPNLKSAAESWLAFAKSVVARDKSGSIK